MCGIVGYIGNGSASEIILVGLSHLEYRGYDSAGIALITQGNIQIEKKVGKLKVLADHLDSHPIYGNVGIGHTRWATHGIPSDTNSHPHYSSDLSVAVVHNGIIENYIELRNFLISCGYVFISETDTEVIAHLFHNLFNGNPMETLKKVLNMLKGSYALGIIHKDFPDKIFCARKDSPLVIGIGDNENFIASDVPALLKYTKDVYFLENGDYGCIEKNCITLFDKNNLPATREKQTIIWNIEQASKGGYPHFMIKEILEQPSTLSETFNRKVNLDDYSIDFKSIFTKEEFLKFDKIHIIACGTAYHAGLQGEHALKKIAKIESNSFIASEYRYSDPFINENTLVIVVSQSGETLDTLLAMKECQKLGATALAITNVVGSSIARDADKVVYTMAGPEIAVASTKAYTNQVMMLQLLAIYIAELRGILSFEDKVKFLDNLSLIPSKIEEIIKDREAIKSTANFMANAKNGFYIGRGLDFKIALEGSLKMKEITYIHTEAFPSGELKHGTISLIEDGIPAIVLATQRELIDKSISNIMELTARGAHIISVTSRANKDVAAVSSDTLFIPETLDIFTGLLSVIPLQLLAYYTSVIKEIDVDKPRNLAKSVTVE